MGRPRFLFVARVVPTPTAAPPPVAWRLVGGNNHELGRSFAAFADLAECVAAVGTLQARADELVTEPVVPEHGPAQWGWRLALDGEVVAMSGRWYRRAREADYSLHQFLAVAPDAAVSDVVGAQPPRRELLRPEFVLPHDVVPTREFDDLEELVVVELADQDPQGSPPADLPDAAPDGVPDDLAADLPRRGRAAAS